MLQDLAAWANANEGLLQALGMLAVAGGVLLSPLRGWVRNRFAGGADPAVDAASAAEATQPPERANARASIAVMPFNAPAGDPEHEYLVAGLTEDLVTLLARVPGFLVIARQSTLVYQGRAVDVRQVGRELGVRYVLEGSVRRLDDHLRVTAQLCETESGTQVWSGRFDRSVNELPKVQDELTHAIATRLEPELVRAEAELIRRRPPADWDAWAYYQRANARLMHGGWHEDTFTEAAALLREAIARDPEFALAHALLALILAFGHRIGLDIDREAASAEALREAERALALESARSDVEGFAGCALADLGYTERGLAVLERAVETNPSNAQAWVALGAARLATGEPERGVQDLTRGIHISPLDHRLAVWRSLLASGLALLGRLEEALEESWAACRQDPRAHIPQVIRALVLTMLGREPEARAALAEARELRPNLSFAEIEIFLSPFAEPLRPIWEAAAEGGEPPAPRNGTGGSEP